MMKKTVKTSARLGCAILTLLLVLSLGTTAYAEGREQQTVTFTNDYDRLSGFAVSKIISNYDEIGDDGYWRKVQDPYYGDYYDEFFEYRNTEFVFYAELDGKPAREQEYEKYNSEGEQVLLLTDGVYTEEYTASMLDELFEEMARYEGPEFVEELKKQLDALSAPYKTNPDGTFTLRHGERIIFKDLPGGTTVHVAEYPTEGFAQKVPAGGADYYGTVPVDGLEEAEFVNKYLITPPPDGDDGKLYVHKSILMPSGYETADAGSFTFTLNVDGSPWAEQEYTIEDDPSESVYKTDAEGRFTLSGGQTAVFEGVPADTEFTISEAESFGWWFAGATLEKNGVQMSFDEPQITEATSLVGDTRIEFANASASFAVAKSLTVDTDYTEKEFGFVLQHEDGSPWPWAEYRLYDMFGRLLDDEMHNTSEAGMFKLGAGQTAMFFGIEPQTAYKVSEQADGEYRQVSPADGGGYSETVKESTQVLHFVNEGVEKTGSLTVTKNVMNLKGSAVPDAKFNFVIYKVTGNTAEPLSNIPYEVAAGDGTYTYKTGADGSFTLKDAQTAVFRYVEPGVKYRVTELDASVEKEKFIPEDGDTREGTVTEDGLFFSFVNDYGDFKEFRFYKTAEKTDAAAETVYLSGAEFMLTAGTQEAGAYVWSQNAADIRRSVSGEDGLVSFTGISAGVYKLEELTPPEGYSSGSGYWIVNIDGDGKPEFTAVGSPKAFSVNPESGELELPNPKILDLPQSGSLGEPALMAASAMLMLAGAVIWFISEKRRANAARANG